MSKGQTKPAAVQRYFAGCGRHWDMRSAEKDLAYTELAFEECPTCPHRVDPDPELGGGPSFCTLRPRQPHPFAGLAGLSELLE